MELGKAVWHQGVRRASDNRHSSCVERLEDRALLSGWVMEAYRPPDWTISGDSGGQPQNDTIVVEVSPTDSTMLQASVNGSIVGSRPRNWFDRIVVKGGRGHDNIVVKLGAEDRYRDVVIRGGRGNDLLIGGPEDDSIRGGPGQDTLYGGRGADTLRGGAGIDELHGGKDKRADLIFREESDLWTPALRDVAKADRLPQPLEALPAAPYASAADSSNRFGYDLYHRLSKLRKDQNLFFSAYSISSALAMTYLGARGQTAEEMARTLRLPGTAQAVLRDYGAMNRLLNNQDGAPRSYELSVANALWGQKGLGFRQEFIQTLQSAFGAGLREVDFATAAETARGTINQWVATETRGKIPQLFGPGSLDSMTRLVLTNAVYFKGTWVNQFEKSDTYNDSFHVTSDQIVNVPMMHQTSYFNYYDGEGFQLLEMPYKGDEVSMIVLLPRQVNGLAKLERLATPQNLAQWLDQANSREVYVSFPKFKMSADFGLADVLAEMGMPTAFTESADFSGMAEAVELFITSVVHKAYVDVNEEGTEAAAATGVSVGTTSIHPPPEDFRADHPFMFGIRDLRSGGMLFMGRVINPQAT